MAFRWAPLDSRLQAASYASLAVFRAARQAFCSACAISCPHLRPDGKLKHPTAPVAGSYKLVVCCVSHNRDCAIICLAASIKPQAVTAKHEHDEGRT